MGNDGFAGMVNYLQYFFLDKIKLKYSAESNVSSLEQRIYDYEHEIYTYSTIQ